MSHPAVFTSNVQCFRLAAGYHKIVLKPRQRGYIFITKFECNRSTRLLSVGIKYSKRDL